MSALSDLLERLRRMRPPPGAPAAVVAVPSPAEGVEVEVGFLFDDLDAVEARAGEVRAEARAAAAAIEADASSRRALLLAQAADQGERVWNELLAARRAAYRREADAMLAASQRTAGRVLVRGATATPAVVAEILHRIEATP